MKFSTNSVWHSLIIIFRKTGNLKKNSINTFQRMLIKIEITSIKERIYIFGELVHVHTDTSHISLQNEI